jgi:hypothetical protein
LLILALRIAFESEKANLACYPKSVSELEHHQLALSVTLARRFVFELER